MAWLLPLTLPSFQLLHSFCSSPNLRFPTPPLGPKLVMLDRRLRCEQPTADFLSTTSPPAIITFPPLRVAECPPQYPTRDATTRSITNLSIPSTRGSPFFLQTAPATWQGSFCIELEERSATSVRSYIFLIPAAQIKSCLSPPPHNLVQTESPTFAP